MTRTLISCTVAPSLLLAGSPGAESPSRYDVVWEAPSADHHGSMPLGNGSTGMNAWIEPSGDLCFFIGRTDSWGDNARLLKLGMVRVKLDPAPRTDPFRQTLSLADATMEVRYGEGDDETVLRVWVDANHPVIHVSVESSRELAATASVELWRTERSALPNTENSDILNEPGAPEGLEPPTIVEPDTLLTGQTGRIGWYHRNIKSVGPAALAKVQGVSGFPRPDPLLGRTFGAIVTAEGARAVNDTTLLSPPAKSHCFSVYVDTLHPATGEEWVAMIEGHIREAEAIGFAERRRAHEEWWAERWGRSRIDIYASDRESAGEWSESDPAFVLSRAYALQRFITICAGRGAYPIKFNGSIFTVPHEGKPGGADFRRWGPGYWWQNTRLPYLSVLASGDRDLMLPLVEQYVDRHLPLNQYRTQRYFGHGGAYYPETVYFWGDVISRAYGWQPMEEREDPLQQLPWHKWEWVAGLELAYMLLDYYEHTQDREFLANKALPTADAVTRFFDEYFSTSDEGKLILNPAQALESWWECTNPMSEVAGLQAVLDRLIALPEDLATPQQRTYWAGLRRKVPELPTREIDGKMAFAPAEHYADKRNIENPELYCVFPFRLASFNRDNADLARVALEHRWDRGGFGWRQDDIFMAYLGLAEEARAYVVERSANFDQKERFPAFWGPNYDWTPDQDHGGVLMKAVQAMLMQCEPETGSEFDGQIHLLPAWPSDWDADFKLHAPCETVVEASVRGGLLVHLAVTPPERLADVRVNPAFSPEP